MDRISLDEGQRQAFDQEIATVLGVAMTSADPVPGVKKEGALVFDFSK